MEVYFASKKLTKSIGTEASRTREFGAVLGKKLALRLSQLSAARSLETMRSLPGRCHELHGDREGALAVDLTANVQLIFVPAHDPVPERGDGGLDWAAVTAVRIVEVTDYHGR